MRKVSDISGRRTGGGTNLHGAPKQLARGVQSTRISWTQAETGQVPTSEEASAVSGICGVCRWDSSGFGESESSD